MATPFCCLDSRKAINLEQQTQRSSKSLPRKDKHSQHKVDPAQGNHTGKENITRPNRTTERRPKRDRQSRRFTSMSNLSECKQETKTIPRFEGKGDANVNNRNKVYTQSPTGSTSLRSPHFQVRGDHHKGPPPQVPNRTDAPFMASYAQHQDNLPNVQREQAKYQQQQTSHNDKNLICQILTDMNINPSECEILIDSDNVQQSTIPLSPCPTLSNAEVRPSPIGSSNYSGYYSDNATRMGSMPRNANTFYTQHVVPQQYQMVHPRPPVNFHARMDHMHRPHMAALHQGYIYSSATATLHHCPPTGSSPMVNAEGMGVFRDKRNIPISKQTSRPPYGRPHVFDNKISVPIMMNSLPCEPFVYDHNVMQEERLANSLDHPTKHLRNTRPIPIDRAANPASVAPVHLTGSNQHNAIVNDVIQRIRPLIKEIVQEEMRKANQKWMNGRSENDSAAFATRRKEDRSQGHFMHNSSQLHHPQHNQASRDWEGGKRQKDDQRGHHIRSQAGTKSESKDAHGVTGKQGTNASRIQDISHSESLPSASFDDEFWRGESGQSPAVNKMIFDKLLRQQQSGKRVGDYKEKQRLGGEDEIKESEDDIAQKDDQSVEGLSPASDATSELSDSALNDEMIFIPGVGGFGTFLPVNIGPGFVQEAAYPNFFVSMNSAEQANVIDPKSQTTGNEKRNDSHKEEQQGHSDVPKGKDRQKDRVEIGGSKRNGVTTHSTFLNN